MSGTPIPEQTLFIPMRPQGSGPPDLRQLRFTACTGNRLEIWRFGCALGRELGQPIRTTERSKDTESMAGFSSIRRFQRLGIDSPIWHLNPRQREKIIFGSMGFADVNHALTDSGKTEGLATIDLFAEAPRGWRCQVAIGFARIRIDRDPDDLAPGVDRAGRHHR